MKKMSKGMLMTALICGAVYLGGSTVYANELQEFALDEYVVTAARTETKLVDTPANISVVDAQTIEERHYQDVSEVLKDVPGATVVDNGVGASEKVVRLNGDDRVLVLVDGRRVSTDIGSTSYGRNNMDMNQLPDVGLIERIEVLKGAGGALYGSEAVGGVVNIITKKADRNYGKVSLAYGSMGTKDYNAMYSIREGKTGVSLAASKYNQDYYKYKDAKLKTTKRWPDNSSYENEKISLKLEQEITDESNLTFGYDYSNTDGTNTFDITGTQDGELEKRTSNLYMKYDWNLNENDLGYIQVYHNNYKYNNYTVGAEGYFEEKTNGIDLQQELTVSNENKMVLGATWRKSDVDVTGGSVYNESIDNLAIYVNDNWEFSPSWVLNAGVRYDNHSVSGDELTLSTGINKKFNDNSHVYFNWGEVFRTPTTDDLFQNSIMGEYVTRGNRNLKPETGDTWTLGYATRIGDFTNIHINYFESDLKDAINWDYTSIPNTCFAENVDKQKKRGMELAINHQFNDKFDMTASYTYLKVKSDKGTGYLRDGNAIPNMYRLDLRYHVNKWNANLIMRAGTGADKNKYVNSSYLTVDCSVTYQANDNLNLFAKGYNLFNEAYAEQGGLSYGTFDQLYPAQSRRFIVGAEYKF